MKGYDFRWDCAVDVRNAIGYYTEAEGYPPSIRNLQSILGLSSPSLAALHLKWAINFGIVEQTPGMARTIRLPRATA